MIGTQIVTRSILEAELRKLRLSVSGTGTIYQTGGTDLAVADGGTGASTFALNGVLYGNEANPIGVTAIGAEGQFLRVGASPFVPVWSTLILPNAATAYRLPVATGANTIGELAAVGATGEYLAGATGAIPVWATLNQAAVAGLTTTDGPTWDHVHIAGGTDILFSTYKGADSDGCNIFIGGGGQSSVGAVDATYKGSYNNAMGGGALHANTTGYCNNAMGHGALYANTTGNCSNSIGFYALNANTTGYNNNAMGYVALYANTTGCKNNAMGYAALYDLDITAGDGSGSNTAIGHNTGRGITTGINNTIIGANVTGLAAALSNNIILANGAGIIKAQHDNTNWMFTGDIACAGDVIVDHAGGASSIVKGHGGAGFVLYDYNGAADGKYWRWTAAGDGSNFDIMNDAGSAATAIWGATRSGMTVTEIDMYAPLKTTGAFGCNNVSPQTPYASGAAITDTPDNTYSDNEVTMLNNLKTLINNIRTALVNNGIMS